jgi:hypothetical protein
MNDDIPIIIQTSFIYFEHLWMPSLFIFLFGFIVSFYALKNIYLSLSICLFKALLFFIYFNIIYDGKYNSTVDDYWYIYRGSILLEDFLKNSFADINFTDSTQTFHFFFVVIAALSEFLFGQFYSSLTAINVSISFLCGLLAYKIIYLNYSNLQVSKYFYIAMVLYPDMLSWSTVYAGKDTFVVLGHLLFIYSLSFIFKNNFNKGFSYFLLSFIYMVNLRFYVSIIFLIYLIKNKILIFAGSFALAILFVFTGYLSAFASLYNLGISSIENFNLESIFFIPLNILKFWLSPRPFFEDPNYQYLIFSSIFNWLAFPFIIIGIFKAIKSKDLFANFVVSYFLLFTLFYVFVDFLRGPRHRFQLVFALIFFLWFSIKSNKHKL